MSVSQRSFANKRQLIRLNMKKKRPTRTGMKDSRPTLFCERFLYNENALYRATDTMITRESPDTVHGH